MAGERDIDGTADVRNHAHTSEPQAARRGPRIGSTLAVMAIVLAMPGTATALPPEPPNPDKDRISAQRERARQASDRVGELANRLADVEARLTSLATTAEVKMEQANKAGVDLRRARSAYERAERDAAAASAAAEAAARRVDRQRRKLDRFAAASYRQGSRLGSLPAFVGADGPRQMLDRAAMLDALGESQLDVLDELRSAQARKANKDSAARAALRTAESKRKAAVRARREAERARDAAVAARNAQRAKANSLRDKKAAMADRLARARSRVDTLTDQRERHNEWQAAKRREQQAAAQETQPSAPQRPSGTDETSGAVETVIARAKSQLGVTYAWGGGNASGPTRGIRDGGVADAHGDFRKIGFDCSGLMIYAFAGVGIELPHYSGYQYRMGTRVPLSNMQRGDMLFWDDGGSVHHVALYLGNGRMIEAPYSGAHVRVTSVRYGGIAPYAVRLV